MIVVLTDLRRTTHLAATLRDVDSSARSQRKVVLVDGSDRPEIPDGWDVCLAPKPTWAPVTENRWTTWRAFELAAEAQEDLLFLEDDVIGSKNAALYAEGFAVPGTCALVSFYAPWGDATIPWRLWRNHASQFSFCQALKVPLRTCQALCDARAEMEACPSAGSDECIRAIGAARDWVFGIHYPGLFQHVGDVSIVNGERYLGGARVSRAWLPDFDATFLLEEPWKNDYR